MTEKFKSISELFDYAERDIQSTTLVGMVKPCEDDRQHFMFSATNCDNWLKIPSSGVDEVEYLGQAGCRKKGEAPHSHALVRLRLTKQCVAELPYLTTVSALINQKQPVLRRLAASGRFMSMRGLAAGPLSPRLEPCFLVNDNGSIVLYCCDENGDNCEPYGIV
jgi:hypothetical protein